MPLFTMKGFLQAIFNNKGKTEARPVEKVSQKEESKALEAFLLKKGMELMKSYPVTFKEN